MSTRRFYVSQQLDTGSRLAVTGAAANHIAKVLRLRVGDPLILFDGLGSEHEARIIEIDRRTPVVEIGAALQPQPPARIPVHLAVAIARGASMDYTMQKATEMGASRITPLVSERSAVRLTGERGERKLAHWREVCASSCEQCGRHYPPDIEAPQPLPDWLAQERGELKLMLHPEGQESLRSLASQPRTVTVATGPEGGFSEREVAMGKAAGFQLVRVGPRTLRAETAPVVALALVQYLWGDLASP